MGMRNHGPMSAAAIGLVADEPLADDTLADGYFGECGEIAVGGSRNAYGSAVMVKVPGVRWHTTVVVWRKSLAAKEGTNLCNTSGCWVRYE